MKALAFLLMCGALLVPCGYSQSAPIPVATTITRHFDGKMEKVEFAVTNLSREPLTAYAIGVRYESLLPQGPAPHTMARYVDSVCNLADHPQMWKETRTYVFGGPGPNKATIDVALKAAIFEDGTSFGDPAWVSRVVQRRKFFYQNLTEALELVQNARSNQETGAQLMQEATSREKRKLAQAQSPEERAGIHMAFADIVANLQHMISGGGSPQSAERKMVGIERLMVEQRQALLSSEPPVTE